MCHFIDKVLQAIDCTGTYDWTKRQNTHKKLSVRETNWLQPTENTCAKPKLGPKPKQILLYLNC